MADINIRRAQLIDTFGPGSIYIDPRGRGLVVCGLDHWHKEATGQLCTKIAEFQIIESRLSSLLGGVQFRHPPDFRRVQQGMPAEDNANLTIPALRFPCWYYETASGKLHKLDSTDPDAAITRRERTLGQGVRLRPVRFAAVCGEGHLCEFPWREWAGCNCQTPDLRIADKGGSDLSSIRVACHNCGNGATLTGTTARPTADGDDGPGTAFSRRGISCRGSRPWLGESGDGGCNSPLSAVLINQSNLYYARTRSSIFVPVAQQTEAISNIISVLEAWPRSGKAQMKWQLNDKDGAVESAVDFLEGVLPGQTTANIKAALAVLFDPRPVNNAPVGESRMTSFRREEYNALREPTGADHSDSGLRVVNADAPADFVGIIDRVRLVERLQETRAHYGFSRLQQTDNATTGDVIEQLFHTAPNGTDRWLPAMVVRGEGIYLELAETTIDEWRRQHADFLEKRYAQQYRRNLARIPHPSMPDPDGNGEVSFEWTVRFVLVHSLAHAIIRQLVFECGYSTASLRERLFVSADANAPMAALLLYTASGDSEGSLGGLVRLGRPGKLGGILRRAMSAAAWCSADPVCSEVHAANGGEHANYAACHACLMLPETACETMNRGLDRALLVGTPTNPGVGFFADRLPAL